MKNDAEEFPLGKDPEDRDTLPPTADPVAEAVALLHGKVDTVITMLGAFFEELQREKSARLALADDVAFLMRASNGDTDPIPTNGNGSGHG